MPSSVSAEYSASASNSFSSTSLASSISPGARRARSRTRRNTGTSSSWIENSTPLLLSASFTRLRMNATRTVRVAFILNLVNDALKSKGVLFSIHDEDVPVFRLVRLRARRAPGLIEDAKEVLLKLFDADAEYSADTLEGIYDELEKVSKQVLAGEVTDTLATEVLGAIARQEDLNGRIRRNVMDTRRAEHAAAHHEAD